MARSRCQQPVTLRPLMSKQWLKISWGSISPTEPVALKPKAYCWVRLALTPTYKCKTIILDCLHKPCRLGWMKWNPTLKFSFASTVWCWVTLALTQPTIFLNLQNFLCWRQQWSRMITVHFNPKLNHTYEQSYINPKIKKGVYLPDFH